jgi:hypothetical protein
MQKSQWMISACLVKVVIVAQAENGGVLLPP